MVAAAQRSVSSSSNQTTNKPKQSTNQLSILRFTKQRLFLSCHVFFSLLNFSLLRTRLLFFYFTERFLYQSRPLFCMVAIGQMGFVEEQMRLSCSPKRLSAVNLTFFFFSFLQLFPQQQQPTT